MDLALDGTKQPTSRLKAVLAPLEDDYDYTFLDCPPSVSLVSESVFEATDVLLVPIIPATLSSRTFEQIEKLLVQEDGPRVMAFFSMVDKRKHLHRDVMAQLRDEQPGALLDTAIPMAADVERMGSNRRPIADFAPRSPAAKAYAALWEEIQARLELMRLLFTCRQLTGHLYPLLPLAEAAKEAGHRVAFATGEPALTEVRARGWTAFPAAPDPGAREDFLRAFPQLLEVDPEEHRALFFSELFVRRELPARLAALTAIVAAWRPDAIVNEVSRVRRSDRGYRGGAALCHRGLRPAGPARRRGASGGGDDPVLGRCRRRARRAARLPRPLPALAADRRDRTAAGAARAVDAAPAAGPGADPARASRAHGLRHVRHRLEP